jgi:hypothetical protein
MKDGKSLAELKAERAKLDQQIAEAEGEKAALDYNESMANLQVDLEAFAHSNRIDRSPIRRRKNEVILHFGSIRAGRTLRVGLYYDEDDYPVGGTVLTVTDQSTGTTASFDAIPPVDALTGLLAGWLGVKPSN